MRRLIRHSSTRFTRRTNDYSYPQLRLERPRVSRRQPAAAPEQREHTGLSRSEGAEAIG